MTTQIELAAEHFAILRQHLAEPEHVAFMYARFIAGRFTVVDLEPMSDSDVASQSDLHVVLQDDVRPRLISKASAGGLSLVEAHSHGRHGKAAFSPSDLLGFEEWVPHLWWRLHGRPYAALVVAGDCWDGLTWLDGPREPRPIAGIEIADPAGTTRLTPTGTTFLSLHTPRKRRHT